MSYNSHFMSSVLLPFVGEFHEFMLAVSVFLLSKLGNGVRVDLVLPPDFDNCYRM